MKKILIIIFALLLSYHHASAATIEFSKLPDVVHQGDTFEVSLSLDPKDVSINTLAGSIKASGSLDIDKVSEGGSFVPLWIEKPRIDNGIVSFSGLVPGGFSGILGPYWDGKRPGKILTITLKANSVGSGSVEANLDTLLSNDGSATAVSVKPSSLYVSVLAGQGQAFNKSKDKDNPEPFNIEIANGWGDFTSQRVALFSTYDEQSGISHFMVREGNRNFATETSPYILKDKGESSLFVRAYDNSGNYQEAFWDASVADLPAQSPFSGFGFWVILIASLSCIALLLKRFSGRSR